MSDLKLSICEKVCPQCPFRKNAGPGWLGPHSVEEIQETMSREALFSCHMKRTDDVEFNKMAVEVGQHPICRGFVISASKSCKRFGGNPDTGQELWRLQEGLDRSSPEFDEIMSIYEFIEHHGKQNTALSAD